MSLTKTQKILIGIAFVIGGGYIFLKSEGYARDKGIIRKLKREEVNYQDPYFVKETGLYYKCEDCIQYIKPGMDDVLPTCTLIEGNVTPTAGCNRWAGLKAYRNLDQLQLIAKDESQIKLDFITSSKTF